LVATGFFLQWVVPIAILTWTIGKWHAADAVPPGIGERLVGRTMVFAALLATLGAVSIGASHLGERYMYPILTITPLYLYARVARGDRDGLWIRRFAVGAVVVFVGLIGLRVAVLSVPLLNKNGQYGTLLPFESLAAALQERGIADGTVVTAEILTAGNLRSFIANLRVVSPESYRLVPVPRRASDENSCVLVWNDRSALNADLAGALGDRARERLENRSAPSLSRTPSRAVWWLARLDPQSLVCR
jgi:hypothetical protein